MLFKEKNAHGVMLILAIKCYHTCIEVVLELRLIFTYKFSWAAYKIVYPRELSSVSQRTVNVMDLGIFSYSES